MSRNRARATSASGAKSATILTAIVIAALSMFSFMISSTTLTPSPQWLSVRKALELFTPPQTCDDHRYTTEIVSLDPLVIYIPSFVTSEEINGILKASKDSFNPSLVKKNGKLVQNEYRTSWSALLSDDIPSVQCVLERSRKFLGTVLDPVSDEMGVPQLVRYTEGQKYNLHHDWFRVPMAAFDGSPRSFNRVVSFFVVLEDSCEGGETWFPFIPRQTPHLDKNRLWHDHEEGGLAFKPVAGNAIFWVNLSPNGTGDERTVHAGLPVVDGLKTAMNIWPRQYYNDTR